MEVDKFTTSEALAVARVSHEEWRSGVNRGVYRCAPPTSGPRGPRAWSVDAVVVFVWYCELVKAGMKRTMAGELAELLTTAVERKPRASSFNVYCWEDPPGLTGHLAVGTESPAAAPDAAVIMTIPLAAWRRNVALALTGLRHDTPH